MGDSCKILNSNIPPKIRFVILDFEGKKLAGPLYSFVSYEDVLKAEDLNLTEWGSWSNQTLAGKGQR